MCDNQTQYSEQEQEKLKKEIEELLSGDKRVDNDDREVLTQNAKELKNAHQDNLDKTIAKIEFNLGIFYHKQGEIKQAKQHWQNIQEEYDLEQYAKAQLNLGFLYVEQGDIEQTKQCWLNIQEKHDLEQYAMAQFNLGVLYDKQGDIEQAKQHWLNIQEKHGLEKEYATAQLNLGVLYHKQGDIEQTKQHWLNIQEKHDLKIYVQAQFNLGVLYHKQGDIEQAKQHWLNIQEKHDLKIYAEAQLNLGAIYYKQGEIEQAKQHWLNIQEKHGLKQYTKAQLNLGAFYYKQGDIEQAKQCWLNIQEKHDLKQYAYAQLNLGVLYRKQGDIEQTKQHWLNIQEKHDLETFARIQFSLGLLYEKQGDIKQAKQHWLNIQEKHDLKTYAMAQLSLGLLHLHKRQLYEKQDDIQQVKQYWQNIQEKHDVEIYSKIQLILGLLDYKRGDIEQAKQYWLNIQKEYDLEAYAKARFMLAIIYAKEKNETEFKQCIIELKKYYHQDDYYIQHVIDNVQNVRILLKNKGILLEILDHFLDIRNALQVVRTDTPVNSPERTFAHYTEIDSAINLLKNKENKDEKEWNFRMASVEQLNDPTEGLVLFEFLNNYSEKLKQQNITIEKSEKWAIFTACFTFNHDSLNQFRLYGKKQNQEVTGVSLVFQPSFFDRSHSGIMDTINVYSSAIKEINKNDIEQSQNNGFGTPHIQTTPNNDNMVQHHKQDEKILLLPLYRCIYLDPESFMKNENEEKVPYLKIAARDELTFYREKDKKVNDFKKYKTEIENIEKEVLKSFKEMIKNIEILFSNLNKKENNEEILNTLGLILLPLSHLIKHSAFHEEQECRIIYCCPFDDEDIDKTESHKAKIFREYRPIINDKDIARIYLSKGAENYAHIFKSLGIKTVRISSNPFRTAEKE